MSDSDKKRKAKPGGIFILILTALYITAINLPADFISSDEAPGINVYFFNSAAGRFESERRSIPSGEYMEIATYLLEILISGPQSHTLSAVFPENLSVESFTDLRAVRGTVEDRGVRRIEIYLNEDYLETPAIAEVLFRSAVVWSFTDLDWVTDVVFFVGGAPLTRLDGNVIGPMDRDNVLIRPQITTEHTVRKTVELYFPNSNLTGLVAERRTIEVPSNLTEELVVLKELMRGPYTPGLLTLIPPETIINDVYTESITMTSYVDLSPAFDTRLTPGTPTRTLAVYSIVNTLIRLEEGNISRVQFLINGERIPSRNLDVDLSQAFEADESFIIHRMELEIM